MHNAKSDSIENVEISFIFMHIFWYISWKNVASTIEYSFNFSLLFSLFTDVTKITDLDFQDVITPLAPNQLKQLYMNLGLKKAAIEKAERRANSTDEDLKAMEVLQLWRQMHGRKATREKIIETLTQMQNLEVVQALQKKWNLPA